MGAPDSSSIAWSTKPFVAITTRDASITCSPAWSTAPEDPTATRSTPVRSTYRNRSRIGALEVGQDLLDEDAAVDAPLLLRQHGPVAIVVDLQQLADAGLGDDFVEGLELGGDLVEELGVLGHGARLGAQPALAPDQVVPQVHEHVVEGVHPHVAGEALHADRGARLRNHQVEQVLGVVEGPLGVGRLVGAELGGDVVQRTFEVGGQLAGVPAGRAPRDPVAFDEQHSASPSSAG